MVKQFLLFYILCIFIIGGSSSANTTESALLNTTNLNFDLTTYLVGNNESLQSCWKVYIKPMNYDLRSNGSVLLKNINKIINEEFLDIINGTLYFCNTTKQNSKTPDVTKPDVIKYILLVIKVISMICLLLHMIVFCLVPDLRNLPGWNLAALCSCMFTTYGLGLVLTESSDEFFYYGVTLGAFAYAHYFFLMSCPVWMSIISCDVFKSVLRATKSFRNSSSHFTKRKFCLNCLCAFGIALLFCIFSLLAENLDIVPEQYRPDLFEYGWFDEKAAIIFYVVPVSIILSLNFILFGVISYLLHVNKRKSDEDAKKIAVKRRYLMYFKLSVIMGVNWFTMAFPDIINSYCLNFIVRLLNDFHSIFIFLGFTCSKKVKKHFRKQIIRASRSSEQILTPALQTHSVYLNSIEKDLDKKVESNNKIIIHL